METMQKNELSDETLNTIDEYIGTRIKLRRNLLGLSQHQLAKILNVSFQQLQKYEKGINRISGSRVWHISRALNTPVSYFFDGIESNLKINVFNYTTTSVDYLCDSTNELNISQQPYELQKQIKELINAFIQIHDPEIKNNILSLVKSFLDSNNKND